MKQGVWFLAGALACSVSVSWAGDANQVTGRAESIVAKLAEAAGYEEPLEVIIVPDPSANAAGGGGRIFVHHGLLDQVQSDDELAGVLGHELGHIVSHHFEKRKLEAKAGPIVAVAGGAAGGLALAKGKNWIKKAALAGGVAFGAYELEKLYAKKFERDEEVTADALGVKFAHDAGYDPRAILKFLAKIAASETKEGVFKRLLASHPVAESRIRKISRIIEEAYGNEGENEQPEIVAGR